MTININVWKGKCEIFHGLKWTIWFYGFRQTIWCFRNMPTAEMYVLVGDQNSLIQMKKENNNYLPSLDNWKSEKKYQQNALLNVCSVCLSQLIYLFNIHIDTHNLFEKRWKKILPILRLNCDFILNLQLTIVFTIVLFLFFLFRWTHVL